MLPEEKMVDILYDMSLISVSKGINKRILENNGMKHGIKFETAFLLGNKKLELHLHLCICSKRNE